MNNVILFVFEGEKTEPRIFGSLQRNFFSKDKNTMLFAIYRTDIYQLWKSVSEDDDLDLIELLREREPGLLPNVMRKDISQIFLFFDHDAHARKDINITNTAIKEMLTVFDNETEKGKLYISYPMVEAIQDCKYMDTLCLKRCYVSIENNTEYKKLAKSRSDFLHIRKLNKRDWLFLINTHIKKANCLVNKCYSLPEKDAISSLTQINVFINQEKMFISQNQKIAILSAFPLFIIEYFNKEIVLSEILDYNNK